MSWNLPPSANVPSNPYDRFYSFIMRNASKHGMPVLPNPFNQIVFYCVVNSDLDDKTQPVVTPMKQLANDITLHKNTTVDPLLIEAMAASNWNSILCYDKYDNSSVDNRSPNGTWRQPIYLRDLIEKCSLAQIGVVIVTNKTSIILSPGTITRLNGFEFDPFKYQSPANIEEKDIGKSLLAPEQLEFFSKMLNNKHWIDTSTIKFGSVNLGFDDPVNCVSFATKPGADRDFVKRECGAIQYAISSIIQKPFAVFPRLTPQQPYTRDIGVL